MFKNILAGIALSLALLVPGHAATPVNINAADAETIAKSLDGIGLSKATAIVAFRAEHGPFKSVEELTQVKGIGQATLQRNHDAILLSDDGAKAAQPKSPRKTKLDAEEAAHN